MHKNWLRVFLLCVACILCLYGNCAAEDEKENWVQYYYHDDLNIFYVDTDSIRSCEYEGRKYLEAIIKRKKQVEKDVVIGRIGEVTYAKFHILFDVENRKAIYLEWYNEAAKSGRKKGKRDISRIKNEGESISGHTGPEKLLPWIEQNFPSVIQEIRTFNNSTTPSAGTQTVTADGDYGFVQMLGDGPVQYSARMIHKPPTPYVKNDGITRSYVSGVPASGLHCEHGEFIPPVAPNSGKPLYIIYRGKDSQWDLSYHLVEHWVYAVFSYDDETDTFTLYNGNNVAYKKIHIVDENTVEVDRIGDSGSFEDGVHFTYEYKKTEKDYDGWWNEWQDEDGYEWQATYSSGGWVSISEFDLIERAPVHISDNKECHNEVGLDGLFVFLARKGNVGYAPLNAPLNTAKLQYIFAAE